MSMFDFFGGIFKGIGVAIGAAFIAVGSFFGSPPPLEPPANLPPQEIIVEATTTQAEIQPTKETTPSANQASIATQPSTVIQPQPTVIDVCINIEGIQTVAPTGFSSVANICTVIQITDLCPNISGVQKTMPYGMTYSKKYGKCLTSKELNTLEAESVSDLTDSEDEVSVPSNTTTDVQETNTVEEEPDPASSIIIGEKGIKKNTQVSNSGKSSNSSWEILNVNLETTDFSTTNTITVRPVYFLTSSEFTSNELVADYSFAPGTCPGSTTTTEPKKHHTGDKCSFSFNFWVISSTEKTGTFRFSLDIEASTNTGEEVHIAFPVPIVVDVTVTN